MLRDKSDEIIVIDNKTASKPMANKTADNDNQMTAYSYLLAANKCSSQLRPSNAGSRFCGS
jgi:putative RecB family exonuclease